MDTKTVGDSLTRYLEQKAKAGNGTPEDLAIAGFKALTQDQSVIGKAGAAYCMTQQSELYYGSMAVGGAAGILVALLLTSIFHILFGRRR